MDSGAGTRLGVVLWSCYQPLPGALTSSASQSGSNALTTAGASVTFLSPS